jgi:hypothetical protein
MAVVEFEGFEVGSHPWTLARVREAATAAGPWTVLETVAITVTAGVVDTFETTLATLDNGWYSIVWIDADGNVSTPTGPVFNGQSGNHRAQLARMVAAEAVPVLSDDELDDLLAMYRRIDAAHVAPSQDGWTPTYDLAAERLAAARGSRTEAAGTRSRGLTITPCRVVSRRSRVANKASRRAAEPRTRRRMSRRFRPVLMSASRTVCGFQVKRTTCCSSVAAGHGNCPVASSSRKHPNSYDRFHAEPVAERASRIQGGRPAPAWGYAA